MQAATSQQCNLLMFFVPHTHTRKQQQQQKHTHFNTQQQQEITLAHDLLTAWLAWKS